MNCRGMDGEDGKESVEERRADDGEEECSEGIEDSEGIIARVKMNG